MMRIDSFFTFSVVTIQIAPGKIVGFLMLCNIIGFDVSDGTEAEDQDQAEVLLGASD